MRAIARAARVVVFRHGPAEVRDPARWPDDGLRPLSRKGIQQTRRVATGLSRLVGPVSTLATSPALRASRTAEILGKALDPPRRPVPWTELDAGTLSSPILPRVRRESAVNRTLVIVGHEPTLAEFVGLSLTGEGIAVVRLTKGGAACLEFPSAVRPGAARLLWLLTRKQLSDAGD
ncbi:MAG: histidine phosphatase family protein [Thermoplasmata archaeon]|nr:histidine phosphatase family protein [Thermoplasmata archaeon]